MESNRRAVLRGIGTGAVGLTGLTGAVSARKEDSPDVQGFAESEHVTALLDVLDQPAVETDAAETRVVSVDQEVDLRITDVPTTVGTIVHGRIEDTDHDEALLFVDEPVPQAVRQLADEWGTGDRRRPAATWPRRTGGVVYSNDEGIHATRDPLPGERRRVAKLLDDDPDEVAIRADLTQELFIAAVFDEERERMTRYRIDVHGNEILDEEIVESSDGPSTQDHNRNQCLYQFGMCAVAFTTSSRCTFCRATCAIGTGAAWAGYVSCFICISHICAPSVLLEISDCYSTYQCLQHWDII